MTPVFGTHQIQLHTLFHPKQKPHSVQRPLTYQFNDWSLGKKYIINNPLPQRNKKRNHLGYISTFILVCFFHVFCSYFCRMQQISCVCTCTHSLTHTHTHTHTHLIHAVVHHKKFNSSSCVADLMISSPNKYSLCVGDLMIYSTQNPYIWNDY